MKSTEGNKDQYKANIQQALEDLDFLDSSQSYINILVNAKFMEMAEASFRQLELVRSHPYFCRIDFLPDSFEHVEKLYIGKTSLFREDNQRPIIIDWRSPVANLYYEGRIGEEQYETESGVITGELLRKRQYIIEEEKIKEIRDVDVTARDELLQASLHENHDHQLKDIVATIQAEQNRVIRTDLYQPLIVQGVAGSGKTTIALHRVAYFIYTYAKQFNPENFMILAPNQMFLDYISSVLPELGVDRVKQMTFESFVQQCIGRKFSMSDPSDKLTFLLSHDNEAMNKQIKWVSEFKGSQDFRRIIDRYVELVVYEVIPTSDFKLGSHQLYSTEKMRNKLLVEYAYLPVMQRFHQLKKDLAIQLKQKTKSILQQIIDDYDDRMDSIRYQYRDPEERRQRIIECMDEKEKLLAEIQAESKTAVQQFLKTIHKPRCFSRLFPAISRAY
ncbi:MAG: hypothetical protein E7E23_04905 [Paenibacillus sp.]|uniref:HelD family protein n=1 Tax=Paenibacillus sp. TaxID=58172 RepID=UPI0028FFD131|nr:UvrD-helicase domain-containing protein [Paenibacillus sp.]MDU2239897.1 hypothetical protein [Paenibacillus sp.]